MAEELPKNPLCCICYNEFPEEELVATPCEEKPEELLNTSIGMYHCPDCGAMLLAGIPHFPVCKTCLEMLEYENE